VSIDLKSILSTSLLLAAILLVGRVFGLLRETLLAASFGTSNLSDVAILMMTLPDFLVGILLAGGLSSALVPELAKLQPPQRLSLALKFGALIFAVFLVISLVAGFNAEIIVTYMSAGTYYSEQTLSDFRISFFAFAFVAATGVAASYLNVSGKFISPNVGSIIFNGSVCVYFVAFVQNEDPVFWLAIFLVIAVLLRFIFVFMFIVPDLIKIRIIPTRINPRLFSRFAYGIIGFSILAGSPIIFRSIYAAYGVGYLTWFNFAQKLFDLPLGLIIAPFSIVLLPKLASLFEKSIVLFNKFIYDGLISVFAFSLSSTVIGFIFIDMITNLLFNYGKMTVSDIDRIQEIAGILLVALPFCALGQIAASGLNAQGRAGRFMMNGLIALLTVLGIYFILSLSIEGLDQKVILILFVLFHAILGFANLYSLFSKRLPQWGTLRDVLRLVIVVGGIGLPTFFIKDWYMEDGSTVQQMLLMVSSAALMAWFNRSVFTRLQQYQIET